MKDTLSNQLAQPQSLVVTDHVAVDLLMNLNAARRLGPFIRREQTLGSAAAELTMAASSLSYWVGRFIAAGLVRVTRHEARAGKPIPHYLATAHEFHVPFDAIPPGAKDLLLHTGRRRVFERYVDASDRASEKYFEGGIKIAAHPVAGVELGFIEPEDPAPAPVTEWWGTVSITDEEAAEVHRILNDVHERFGRDQQGPGRRRYAMVIGLAPMPRGR